MSTTRLLFLVRRIGPYHAARFAAAARRLDLLAVETRPTSTEYPWCEPAAADDYRRAAFAVAERPEVGLRGAALQREWERIAAAFAPEVVAGAGWADPEYHAALRWCHQRGVPAVVMSDSTAADEPRRWWREQVKGSLVRGYAAAVVAGSRSRDYLQQLGFPAGGIRAPWDVVDNAYFARGADVVRASLDPSRALPPPQFLCVARFLPKKNLERLLDAYARYRLGTGGQPWTLTLSGSGALEPQLRARVAALGIAAHVRFAGFVQYAELPALYAGAGALVLPSLSDQWGLVVNEAMAAGLPVIVSERCGCVPELVRSAENGWRFDPEDVDELAGCLAAVAGLTPAHWAAMAARSREVVARYSPPAFAEGLADAARAALARRHERVPAVARALLRLVAWRREASA